MCNSPITAGLDCDDRSALTVNVGRNEQTAERDGQENPVVPDRKITVDCLVVTAQVRCFQMALAENAMRRLVNDVETQRLRQRGTQT